MRKATVKRFSGVFLNLINLTAVICIVSLIANIARTNDNTNNLLSLSETEVARAETAVSTNLSESIITFDLKPLKFDIITNEPSTDSEVNKYYDVTLLLLIKFLS